jgi:hypothetical protein
VHRRSYTQGDSSEGLLLSTITKRSKEKREDSFGDIAMVGVGREGYGGQERGFGGSWLPLCHSSTYCLFCCLFVCLFVFLKVFHEPDCSRHKVTVKTQKTWVTSICAPQVGVSTVKTINRDLCHREPGKGKNGVHLRKIIGVDLSGEVTFELKSIPFISEMEWQCSLTLLLG